MHALHVQISIRIITRVNLSKYFPKKHFKN
uniref:Uncharacterized protein n=1 Tax=Anguilla anguilla TaxID=7936 RepID=A0A0E9UIL2_ANGAN